MKNIYDALRKELTFYIEYERGERIRNILHKKALLNYKEKHEPSEYIAFMNSNSCSFKVEHPQSKLSPYYFSMFSEVSQHVWGDCVEECLDMAIERSLKRFNPLEEQINYFRIHKE